MMPPKKIYLSKRVLDEPVNSMGIETYWCPSVSGTDYEYILKEIKMEVPDRKLAHEILCNWRNQFHVNPRSVDSILNELRIN